MWTKIWGAYQKWQVPYSYYSKMGIRIMGAPHDQGPSCKGSSNISYGFTNLNNVLITAKPPIHP